MAKYESIYIGDEKKVYFDWLTFAVTIFLVILGLMSIYSATSNFSDLSFLNRQATSAVIGVILLVALTYVPISLFRNFSYFFYALSILLLFAVLLLGQEINGTKGWIRLGGFSLQPAEIAKLGTLLALAQYLSRRGTDIRTLRDFGVVSGLVILPVILILAQPDVGSASVIMAMYFGVLFWAGFDAFTLFFLSAMPFLVLSSLKDNVIYYTLASILSAASFFFRKRIWITVAAIAVFFILGFASHILYDNLRPHQQSRIDTFLNPGSDRTGSGYNVWQSLVAVGSGGLTGKGYLQGTSTQLRYIPEQWTDFIFSVPSEEFGFLGAALIVGLLSILIFRILRTSFETDHKFDSIVAFGFAIILLYHILINIGMVIGLMPVMGIPLPLLSYGGTSIIFNLCSIGIILNIYRTYRKK